MTKEEYGDFVLRYKGCGACFPMYHTLSRFEKMWFSAIQKDVAELEAQIEKMKCYLPVDERDSDHKWFAYKNLFDTKWKIDYSVQGELPKCNTIKWFENKEAVMFYLVSNGMKYYEEPRR